MKVLADAVSLAIAVAIWYALAPHIGFGGLLVGAVLHHLLLRPLARALLVGSVGEAGSAAAARPAAPQTGDATSGPDSYGEEEQE